MAPERVSSTCKFFEVTVQIIEPTCEDRNLMEKSQGKREVRGRRIAFADLDE